jgi:GT2 family glycosyltransferase
VQPQTQPLVSIVSLTYNRRLDVLDLLSALREQDYTNYETIVVDNASTDGTTESIREQHSDVNVIQNQQNLGMVGYNIGMQQARGQYILFIDDDGLPATTHWITQMVSCFEGNPALGAIACKIRLTATGELAPDNPQHLPLQQGLDGYPCAAFVCTGAGVRAKALETVGYFPNFFFRSYMEFTMSTRLWDAGWQVRYYPDIEVLHKKSPSGVTRAYTYWGIRNYFWYIWMLYPWPAALEETAYHAVHSFKQVLKGACPPKVWWRALLDAVTDCPIARAHREPISRETLVRISRIRGHHRPAYFSERRWGLDTE